MWIRCIFTNSERSPPGFETLKFHVRLSMLLFIKVTKYLICLVSQAFLKKIRACWHWGHLDHEDNSKKKKSDFIPVEIDTGASTWPGHPNIGLSQHTEDWSFGCEPVWCRSNTAVMGHGSIQARDVPTMICSSQHTLMWLYSSQWELVCAHQAQARVEQLTLAWIHWQRSLSQKEMDIRVYGDKWMPGAFTTGKFNLDGC